MQQEQESKQTTWLAELNRTIPQKGQVRIRLDWVELRYSGTPSSPLAYELMGGLQSGKNLITELQWSRVFMDNIQFSLQYNGRWSEQLPAMIHTGTVQMRAFF